MTQREIVGPQERFERSGAQRLRDIRPITTRLWSAMMGEFSGVVLAGGAMAMFVEPALVNLVAPASLLYAGLVMSRRVTLPLRLPQTAGMRDWNYPVAGRPPPAHGGGVDLSRQRSQRPGALDLPLRTAASTRPCPAPPGRARRRRSCRSWRTR